MTSVSILAGTGGSNAYTIPKSLRFRAPASTYLNRTFTTPTNNKIFTWSGWIKFGSINSSLYPVLFSANSGTDELLFGGSGGSYPSQLIYNMNGAVAANITTSQQFLDATAWYHIVLSVDTTQATAANRVKLYVNGAQVTALATTTYPTQNYTPSMNSAVVHQIGNDTTGRYFDGAMAEVNFIDGQALAASSFGTFDTNGVWQPIKYSSTYGTNGFYLSFNSASTTAALGTDSSPNGNTWTTNNFSVTTPGFDYDSLTDTPTSYSATVSNYCILNSLNSGTGLIPDYGGLRVTSSAGAWRSSVGTIGMSTGKWYFEAYVSAITTGVMVGMSVSTFSWNENYATPSKSWSYYSSTGNKFGNSTSGAYGASYIAGAIIGVAFDADAQTLTFYKNGTSQGTAFTSFTGYPAGTMFFPYVSVYNATVQINFGQQPFTYTPPTGYKSYNTYNLPTAPIGNGALYTAVTTYTGNGTSLTVNNGTNTTIGTTFQPDMVWMKSRSAATDHAIYDVLRGATIDLASNTTAAETTQSTGLTAFGSTGFTIGSLAKVNTNAATYVGWQWKANGAGVSNTNGSTTSTVSANTTTGFSVVTYTGTGANATVGHGLGVAPSMIILRARSIVENWPTWHIGLTSAAYVLTLNTTNAQASVPSVFNSTLPTSSVFSIGTSTGAGGSGTTYVAYCWAAVQGYSSFGTTLGNANALGWFVFTGFRPRFVMLKASSAVSDWAMLDSSRSPYNQANAMLLADTAAAEVTNQIVIDFCSNGFVVRSNPTFNANGVTYIYAAFAESPFNTARAF